MKSYSFLKEIFDNDIDDSLTRKRIRKNFHTPQSRNSARRGTIGSFSSITSKYNNIYKDQEPSSM